MTREKAIRILDPVTTGEELAEIEYYGGFSGRTAAVQAVSDACILAVAALREQEQRRWIPVTERLPETDGIYIVCDCRLNGNPWIHAAGFRKATSSWCELHGVCYDDGYGRYSEQDKITHWMPLPEPPKGD